MAYECDFGLMAKDILGSIKETQWNKEIIESWREVAVTHNANGLYNTPEDISREINETD